MSQWMDKAESRLSSARIFGAGAIAILGQFAVDMPGGYFGAADNMSYFGIGYSIATLFVVLICIFGFIKNRHWASSAAIAFLTINIALFILPLAAGPIIPGLVIGWHLVILTRLLLETAPVSKEALLHKTPASPVELWLSENGPAVQHLALVSIVCTLAVIGYELSDHYVAQFICFFLNVSTFFLSTRLFRMLMGRRSRRALLVALPILLLTLLVLQESSFLVAATFLQISLLGYLFAKNPLTADIFTHFAQTPAIFVIFSFLALIALGTLFLSFPAASATGTAIEPLEAMFTAVSAVCVTGLVVLDTANAFSGFGQLVILVLIQVGGLGIMVLSTFAMAILGSRLSIRGDRALRDLLESPGVKSAYRLVTFIIIATLAIEALGAALLSLSFHRMGYDWPQAVWHGIFHAISAFCNAGFSLRPDSLMSIHEDLVALSTISILTILGGLGFLALAAIWYWIYDRGRSTRMSVQAKVILTMTAGLLIFSALSFLLVEWNASLDAYGYADKILNAIFQAAVTRTAGFNSVDLSMMQPATISLMIVFMFIGAAPGGTGGGIKVTTAGILLAAIPSLSAGRDQVVLFKRAIPNPVILRAAAITVATMTIASTFFFFLLLTHDLPYESLLFEVVSALGTVGLSLGVTDKLNTFGQVVIMMAMYFGRIGPLTVALLLRPRSTGKVFVAEENIMVG